MMMTQRQRPWVGQFKLVTSIYLHSTDLDPEGVFSEPARFSFERDTPHSRRPGLDTVIEDDEDISLPNPASPPMSPREEPTHFSAVKAREAAEDAIPLSN